MTLEQLWHEVPGGTATSVLGLASGLAAHHPEIEVVGVSAKHDDPPASPFAAPVPVKALPVPRRLLYLTWQHFGWPDVESATGPVDVTHATTFAIPGTLAPMVVTVHDLAFLHEPDHFTRNGLRFFDRGVKRTLRLADLVVCPSESTAEDCRSIGLRDDRLRIVPWGVDPVEVHDGAVAEVTGRLGLDKPFVLVVGTVEPRKNLARTIEAFDRLGRTDLCLAMVGPAGWKEDVDALISEVTSDVRRLGFVDDADLPALYRGAEVFCSVSLREGFGMPVLEAMTQGAAVVTTAGTSTAELVGDDGVLVDALEVSAIADGLTRALEDAPALGAGARRRSERFSTEAAAAGYAAVYTEAMASEPRASRGSR
ncbi:MAG TPA: glycosyltransferase family 1 protein [Acidimicrobiales bacterium]|nr:glycosyltransferase family 1 protein [Acidimicrobiales bacterium]